MTADWCTGSSEAAGSSNRRIDAFSRQGRARSTRTLAAGEFRRGFLRQMRDTTGRHRPVDGLASRGRQRL